MKNKKNDIKNNSAKKAWFLCLSLAVVLAFSGCKENGKISKNPSDKTSENTPEKASENSLSSEPTESPKTAQKGEKITPQDFSGRSGRYMISDNGWYYLNYEKGIRYFDFATGKELALCNKPECRHDGNIFCVASNGRYKYGSSCLYGDRLFLTAVEETQTQYLYKLLSVALDGSEQHEVATYLTLEKTEGLGIGLAFYREGLFIHQNKVFLPLSIETAGDGKNMLVGTAVIDLDTRKVSALDEELLAKDNPEIISLQGYQNAIYYVVKEGRIYSLKKYCVKENKIEECEMATGFGGNYQVMDEDTVVYFAARNNRPMLYHHSTGKSDVKPDLKTISSEGVLLGDASLKADLNGRTFCFDGEYFYIAEQRWSFQTEDAVCTVEYLHIYNKDFEEIAMINMAPVIDAAISEEKEVQLIANCSELAYLGEDIYLYMGGMGVADKAYMYKMKRSDLLAGTPVLERVLVKEFY